MPARRVEQHYSQRTGWLRAAVLGANDGIVSTAALVVGVAAATPDRHAILLAGLAGMVAGAMSMAAGEYVSVSSQADTENADLAREAQELADYPDDELRELQAIYMARGLDEALSLQVAQQLSARNALAAHARDELGLVDIHAARPIQAAFASASTFAIGAAVPLAAAFLTRPANAITTVSVTSLICLASLGAIAAQVGGASLLRGALRVTFWGTLALALTAAVGKLFGATV
ncbi:MAG TPA: VIT family protein [Gemmatimonas aurantiaca]|uniref:VIT family protein n=2 Tax=Gemmatimonas aurantiaca TaxID=173480 RepID=A0A3D4VB34_9BACT|nr:VIT family protein [Gemmatimonas aurantiaca]HCT58054.1 VIT family protein [Gemmatimonas aurantiaca]